MSSLDIHGSHILEQCQNKSDNPDNLKIKKKKLSEVALIVYHVFLNRLTLELVQHSGNHVVVQYQIEFDFFLIQTK